MSNETNAIEETLKKSIEPNRMAGFAKTTIKDRTQGMDEKEVRLTVRNIPGNILWEELQKRYALKTDIIRNARAALMVTVDDIDE